METVLTSSYVPVTPIACKFSLNVFCHVLFGLSLLLRSPSGVQFIAQLIDLDVRRRITCPMNLLSLYTQLPQCSAD